MSDSLRDRIAAAMHREKVGRTQLHSYEIDILADAVIRELADECRAGCMWQIPNRIEDMTEAQRERLGLNHYCRYCGGWGPEQSQ